jgi:hypothetical protein
VALSPRFTDAVVNAKASARAALFANGYLRLYTAPQPATADTAVTTQTLLAELRFTDPPFAAPVAGVAVSFAITSDTEADASGDAAWYRVYQSDGTTPVEDGSCGISAANMLLNTVSIVAGRPVAVGTYTIEEPKD